MKLLSGEFGKRNMRINLSVVFMKLLRVKFLFCLLFVLTGFTTVSHSQSNVEDVIESNVLKKHALSKLQYDTDKYQNLSIETLLNRFVQNGSSELFDGTFVYFFEDKIQTLKVHREVNENGLVVESFLPLDTKQNKSSRVLDNQYCSLNNNWQYQFQAMSSSFPFRINNYYHELQQYYDFTLSDIETVAGVAAVGLVIKSKDPYRYSYQLWFEPETSTLLKYKLIDKHGKVIEQYLFTDISIHSTADKSEELKRSKSCREQFQGLVSVFKEYFVIENIPSGYEPVSFRKANIKHSDRLAYQFQLSDGLSSVSIFIEEYGQPRKAINGVLKLGPVNVVGETIDGHQVTVIGAIPITSALHFIKAIKLNNLNVSDNE